CELWKPGVRRTGHTHYPLTLMGYSKPQLSLGIAYDRCAVPDRAAQRMAGHLQSLLEAAAADPSVCAGEIPMLTAAEREQILVSWNDTGHQYPADKCVHQLFEQCADEVPERVAAVFGNGHLSYAELNRRANILAQILRNLGIGAGSLVAISLERTLESLIAIL